METTKELREKSEKELDEQITMLEKKITDLYFSVRLGKQKDVREPRRLRKKLAIMKTVLNEKKTKLSTKAE
ncbi:MAG: 50S ribosomal protein L29 [Candidatus Dojkabacteria bacterium]|nr:50S ribosomal protein L29 [Candidatus Dojkabacteria bacterium]